MLYLKSLRLENCKKIKEPEWGGQTDKALCQVCNLSQDPSSCCPSFHFLFFFLTHDVPPPRTYDIYIHNLYYLEVNPVHLFRRVYFLTKKYSDNLLLCFFTILLFCFLPFISLFNLFFFPFLLSLSTSFLFLLIK